MYGLAVGAGTDSQELKFVCETGLVPLPTFSSLVAREAGLKASDLDVKHDMVVHKSQTTHFHAPLPSAGRLAVNSRVVHAEDQGIAKGAEIRIESILSDPVDGNLTATIESVLQARGDGTRAQWQAKASSKRAAPNRVADLTVQIQVARNSALLYRLCGDRNPIHVDPMSAARAGFPHPILHGLCFYGIICHALVRECCDSDPSRLARLHVNFSAPVFPGDELELAIWSEGCDVAFQVNVPRRQSLVSRGGKATLRPAEKTGV